MSSVLRGAALRWVIAYTLAVLGDVAYFVVLTWVAAEAGGPAWSGTILAVGAVPRLLLLLLGGVLADRADPRRIALWTDAVRGATLVAAAAMAAVSGIAPWWLMIVAAVFGAADACFIPAVGAMPVRLVPRDRLVSLQAWRITGLRIANTLGPAVGAALILFGPAPAFAAIAALFALSVVLLRSLRPRADAEIQRAAPEEAPGTSSRRRLRGTGLTPLIVGTALSELPFSGPVAAGVVLLARERGWNAASAGAILVTFSAVALGTSALLAFVPARLLGRGAALAALTATALLLLALGAAPGVAPAMACGGGLGLTTGITMIVCQGQLQRAAPPELLGRITAALSVLTLGLGPIAYAATGFIANTAGMPMFFAIAGAFVAAAGVVIAFSRFRAPDMTIRT